MKQNRGHARCNAAGLKYLTEKEIFDYVILMDGDGEDRLRGAYFYYLINRKKTQQNE